VSGVAASRWERLGRQLRHPSGAAGRLLGHAMEVANRGANRAAIAALDLRPGDDLLELGCGPGAALHALAARQDLGRICGIDASPAMLAQARRRNRAALSADRVDLRLASFEQLPLPDGCIDKVLAVNVVYFWDNAPAVLAEVRRVLRPGGRIAVYATSARAMRRWKFAGPDPPRLFDREGLAALLAGGGFACDGIAVVEVRQAFAVPGLVATATMVA